MLGVFFLGVFNKFHNADEEPVSTIEPMSKKKSSDTLQFFFFPTSEQRGGGGE